ncbi:MAG: tetratricopeptide repeat protein [Leptolyngbyaceae cyanobacterium]
MAGRNQWAGLVLMLGLGPVPALATPEINRVQLLAQISPTTVTNQLDETSDTLDDGSYFNVHTFEGTAGESIRIDLVSETFDTYLILVGPDGNWINENDDGGDGTNSQLILALPESGTYQIWVNSFSAGETGSYTLTWESATAAEAEIAESLQQAANLNQQAFALYQAGQYQDAEPLLQQALAIRQQQLGEDHPAVAPSLNHLAELGRAQVSTPVTAG